MNDSKEKMTSYHETLRVPVKEFAHASYRLSRRFPDSERFGLISQLRRAAVSVPLNYVEGYARNGEKDYARFLDMAFGSLKEAAFLLEFSRDEGFLSDEETRPVLELADRIAAMLWGILKKIRL